MRGRYKFLNVKAITLQAWTGPEGSRSSRLSEFLDNRHMKMANFYSYASAAFTPRRHSCYSFLLEYESSAGP